MLKRTIAVDTVLVEKLSHLALKKHRKLRGGLTIEAGNAIREYLTKHKTNGE